MKIPQLVTGDDFRETFNVNKGGSAVTINAGATIRAAIVSTDHSSVIIAAVTQSNAAEGADWTNGVVTVEFSASDTQNVTDYGRAKLELEINDDIVETYFHTVEIVKGNIT